MEGVKATTKNTDEYGNNYRKEIYGSRHKPLRHISPLLLTGRNCKNAPINTVWIISEICGRYNTLWSSYPSWWPTYIRSRVHLRHRDIILKQGRLSYFTGAKRVFGPWGGAFVRVWPGSYCVLHSYYCWDRPIWCVWHPSWDAGDKTIFLVSFLSLFTVSTLGSLLISTQKMALFTCLNGFLLILLLDYFNQCLFFMQ